MNATPAHRRLSRSSAVMVIMATLLVGCAAGGAAPSATPSLPPDTPVTAPPDGGGDPGGLPQPTFVVAVPGQQDLRPVTITSLTPVVDGRQVTVQVDWTSGIEPCNVLDHADVQQDGSTFTIALFEGTGDPNAMCIEIAVYKSTLVDLGELEPGSYTVQAADGLAPPASFTVE